MTHITGLLVPNPNYLCCRYEFLRRWRRCAVHLRMTISIVILFWVLRLGVRQANWKEKAVPVIRMAWNSGAPQERRADFA